MVGKVTVLDCQYCHAELTPEDSGNYDPRDVRAKHYGAENDKALSECLEKRKQHIAQYLGKPIDYSMYQQLYHALYVEQNPNEFWWLIQKVQSLNPKIVLETGVKHGGSMLFWQELAGPNSLVIGVDNNDGLEPILNRVLPKYEDRTRYIVYGESADINMLNRVYKILDNVLVDFLFIDGEHRNGIPRKDFDNYAELVRKGGMICLADLNSYEEHEPQQVYDSLVGKKEADPTGTMGVWYKGL